MSGLTFISLHASRFICRLLIYMSLFGCNFLNILTNRSSLNNGFSHPDSSPSNKKMYSILTAMSFSILYPNNLLITASTF